MSKCLAKSAVLIGSMVLSNDSSLHRHPPCQFASTPSPPVDHQGSVVGPPGLARMVFYMSRNLAESAVLIGSTVLSNDSSLHRHPPCQFASTPSPPVDSQGSVVGPSRLANMLFYRPKNPAKRAVLIGSMVLSNDSNLHRHPPCQFASTPSPPVDSQKSVVGPPGLAQIIFYMFGSLAISALLIGSTVLSIDPNSHGGPGVCGDRSGIDRR
jgi:hypothetical protein